MPAEKNNTLTDIFKKIQELEPTLDTIQLLGIDPNNVQALKWYWASRSPKTYEGAVDSFIQRDPKTNIVKMTLAKTEVEENWFWFHSWNKDKKPSNGEPYNLPIVDEIEYGEVIPGDKAILLDQKLEAWGDCLANKYGSAGCTFWLTQPHRLKNINRVISAVFAVFRGKINRKETKKAIARHLQYLMVDHVLEVYEDQWTFLANNIRNYLHLKSEIIIPDSTKRRLTQLTPVFISRLPFVVEGERGTGKLTAALFIFNVWKKQVQPNADLANSSDSYTIIGGAELQGSIHDVQEILTSKRLWEGNAPNAFNGTVIVDDIQLATPDAQYLLHRIIDNGLRNRPDNSGPWFILTVAPSLEKAKHDKKIIPELEIVTGVCRITLPTLQTRLAHLHDADRKDEFCKIVKDFQNQLGKVASSLNFKTELPVDEWVHRPWHNNYTELRLAILQEAIKSLDATLYP